MAKICTTCDTKNRLKMCEGRSGEFKYCVRRTGSLSNVPNSITPFNNVYEIFNNPVYDIYDRESVVLDKEYYGRDSHMRLLLGKIKEDEQSSIHPIGFVIC